MSDVNTVTVIVGAVTAYWLGRGAFFLTVAYLLVVAFTAWRRHRREGRWRKAKAPIVVSQGRGPRRPPSAAPRRAKAARVERGPLPPRTDDYGWGDE